MSQPERSKHARVVAFAVYSGCHAHERRDLREFRHRSDTTVAVSREDLRDSVDELCGSFSGSQAARLFENLRRFALQAAALSQVWFAAATSTELPGQRRNDFVT